jgi:hypothetical protein
LIKHAGAKRILFLVDRSNLGRQALAEFQKFGLKRYRHRRSLERERMYLAKDWPPGYEFWNAHQWAAVKRW